MAFSINDLNYEKDSKERMPWEHYTEEFAKADPAEIAGRLSLPYDEEKKELTLKFLGSVYYISWPDFQVTHEEDDAGFYPLEEMHYAKILAIRFLLNGNVSQGSGRFKTYREMPWGEVYLRQFDEDVTHPCGSRGSWRYCIPGGDLSGICSSDDPLGGG